MSRIQEAAEFTLIGTATYVVGLTSLDWSIVAIGNSSNSLCYYGIIEGRGVAEAIWFWSFICWVWGLNCPGVLDCTRIAHACCKKYAYLRNHAIVCVHTMILSKRRTRYSLTQQDKTDIIFLFLCYWKLHIRMCRSNRLSREHIDYSISRAEWSDDDITEFWEVRIDGMICELY